MINRVAGLCMLRPRLQGRPFVAALGSRAPTQGRPDNVMVEDATPSGPPRRPLPLRLLLLAAGLVACLRYLFAEIGRLRGGLGFPLDDSWIHLQFARNLAHGSGLSYNPGELVTGSTAPLWTALLALLFPLPGDVILWTKLLGIVLYLAGIDATRRLARELGLSRGLAALAAGLTLATSWLVWSALSGMEIPLFVLLSLWGMILHLRERSRPGRPPLSFAVLAVAALARPEGLLLLLLAFCDRILAFEGEEELRWRRPPWRLLLAGAALAACALAGPLCFYAWAGGSVLPTTWAAKGGRELPDLLPDFRYLANVLGLFFRTQPWPALLAVAGAVALAARTGTSRDRGLLPAFWLFGLPLAYSVLTPGPTRMLGNFGRYYFPLFPVLAVLGVLGLEPAALALASRLRSRGLRRVLGSAAAVLILAPALFVLVQGERFYAQNVANVQASDVALARWLARRLPPEAVLAVNDIGAIKYLLPNRVVDLAGIATPEIGREVRQAAAAGMPRDEALLAAIARRRPDYVVIFPAWFPGLARDPRFRPVHALPIPGNVTMGGDEIVVYETPWTRRPLRRAG
jgi:4-amino-4-deoxy-L-arabinose transferase-like glycosyltransferase